MLEKWFGDILANLAPAQRKRAAAKLGQIIRKNNLARQAANEEPDGGSMAPRKRQERSGRIKKRGKMFPKLRRIRYYKIDANPEGFELGFRNPLVANTAAIHHFGQEGYVGKSRSGRTIRGKYAARQLLGFGSNDRDAAIDVAAELVKP